MTVENQLRDEIIRVGTVIIVGSVVTIYVAYKLVKWIVSI
jgi:hypothetical protein